MPSDEGRRMRIDAERYRVVEELQREAAKKAAQKRNVGIRRAGIESIQQRREREQRLAEIRRGLDDQSISQ